MQQALRSIVLKRTQTTATITYTLKRDIHKDLVKYIPNVLTKPENAARKQKITDNVAAFTTESNIDTLGGYSALVSGDWHKKEQVWHRDKFSHVTVQILYENEEILYLERDDGTFWDRIHVPEDPASPFWKAKFKKATKAQFDEWMIKEAARVAKVKQELEEKEAAKKEKAESDKLPEL